MGNLRIALIATIVALQGCAYTNAKLDVHASPEARVAGPLGEVQPLRFAAPQLDDRRPDKDRIGWKRDGFGNNSADITTDKPVEQLVGDAVAKALTDTHHAVGEAGDIQVKGTVERFWFETDMNFWSVKFMGDVQCRLEFVDARTDRSIYKSQYAGSYAETKAGGLNKTWAMIMGKALDKLVEDVVLDENLAAALKGWRDQQALNANSRP